MITANKLFNDCNIIVQSAMLVTSIECDTLNKKNIDLQEELRLIDGKLKSMSVKYNSLEVSYKNISFDLFLYCLFQGTFAKKIKEKRFECENLFYRELEEDKMRWKQSSDQIIYDLMYDSHFIKETT